VTAEVVPKKPWTGSISPERVSVVVPTHRRPELLARALDAIARLDPAPGEVVVAADRCGTETEEVLRDRPVRRVLPSRSGAAAARNAGWRAASGSIVAFTDDDCAPEERWIAELVEPFSDPSVGLVQGRTLPERPPSPSDRTIEVTSEYGLYETCNIAYRRSVLESLGGFDEEFAPRIGVPHFGEDAELAWRARRAGWKTAFTGRAVVRHAVFPSSPLDALVREWGKARLCYLVREVPELRDCLPAGPLWLRRQSARAQLALVGLTLAPRRPLAGLWLALPYLMWVVKGRQPGDIPLVAAKDIVASAALVVGSVRYRSVLL
jgi:GT2 family glycosyltransferase